jgi:hypothetical protein
MSVITLERKIRSVQTTHYGNRAPSQLFIAHGALSKSLSGEIQSTIKNEKIVPVLADAVTDPAHIVDALTASDALIAILTRKALRVSKIRDWLFFELGCAKGLWNAVGVGESPRFKIYVWKDRPVKLPAQSPITAYQSVNLRSKRSRTELLASIQSIAFNLSMLRS